MAERKAFLLRIDPAVLDALQKWADDDLRRMALARYGLAPRRHAMAIKAA